MNEPKRLSHFLPSLNQKEFKRKKGGDVKTRESFTIEPIRYLIIRNYRVLWAFRMWKTLKEFAKKNQSIVNFEYQFLKNSFKHCYGKFKNEKKKGKVLFALPNLYPFFLSFPYSSPFIHSYRRNC